ncbi:MAG: Glu-tRNA(Gln) amidotransferase subunit GatE [Chloroflexota bacterium]
MSRFVFKPFEEMTAEDYAAVGFKSGLEVHQQLLTRRKLFCRCPAGHFNNTEYNAEILRHMRPTLSELGEYDGTALMEFKTKKNIIYRIHYDTVCTYEMDDTPPFEINDEALDAALTLAMVFDSNIVDELHIARKQYLDGSIPTGFQRTAIFSVGGKLPYKDREINIIQMSIEEDSCREASDIGHNRVYLTDRLGMPLVETVTSPEMRTPQEVAEVNNLLRRMVRSTGKVRTGMGAAREDVNVSVTGGTRIEIKGVPRIPMIPLLTYNEAMRQWNLLGLKEELERRGITENTFEANFVEVTKTLRKTRFQPIHDAIAKGKTVNCVILRGYKGLLRWQTQTDTYFSREISDRVRVIACLTTLPNIIHSDSPSESISSNEWRQLKKTVGATENDTVVLVWGDATDAETGAKEIIIRAKEATIGVPSETRQALRDGTNGFERILPGPERMYPDTDLPPKKITEERLAALRVGLPESIFTREARYYKLGIPADTIAPLAISQYANLFDQVVDELGVSPKLAAVVLVQFIKRLRRDWIDTDALTSEVMYDIFKAYVDGKLPKDAILYVMKDVAETGVFTPEMLPTRLDEAQLQMIANSTIEEMEQFELNYPEKYISLAMGMMMAEVRGRADAEAVSEMLSKFAGKEVI